MTRPRYFHISTGADSRYIMRADTRRALLAHLVAIVGDCGPVTPSALPALAQTIWLNRVPAVETEVGSMTVSNATKREFEADSEYYVNHVSAARIA